jgi:hypothetical protein
MSRNSDTIAKDIVAAFDLHSFGDTRGVLAGSMSNVPGYRVVSVICTVYGPTRSFADTVAEIGARLKSLIGDKTLSAVDRMVLECLAKGL